MKQAFKPGTMLNPVPVVLVSCGVIGQECDIVTVAWTGTICTDPPMCYISLRKERYSHPIISKYGEFVINIPTSMMAQKVDLCGVKSGRDIDKFSQMSFTKEQGQIVKAPLIAECPLNIECRVVEVKELGSHDMFLAEVVAVDAEESLIDKSSGYFQINHAGLMCYSHGKYYALGEQLGGFGFSVKKKKHGHRQ